ncbi:MAG: glycosyl hydrolase family 18 [Lachnospira sp.]|nr:glycosyl hydrolase family 18 [Lachnospira sp.]
MNKGNLIMKKKKLLVTAVIALVCIIALGVCVYIYKYAPTSKKMSAYDYFDMQEGSEELLVILDGEEYTNQGVYIDGNLYVRQDLVESDINLRFYYDKETSCVIYSDTHHMYSFKENSNEYTDEEGNAYTSDVTVLVKEGDTLYLNWDYVASHTDLDYVIASDPNRLVITTSYDEETCVDAKSKISVRYRGGVKSEVVESVSKGTRLVVTKELEDWLEVVTPTGVKGYVRTKDVTDKYSNVRSTSYEDDKTTISFDTDINLTWFQVEGTAGNSNISNLLASATGVNVLSPTWYSISGSDGSLSFDGTSDLVTSMHSKGIKVWALVDDFDTSVDFETLFKSKAARTKMINTLISGASTYGFDGINLDFENVNTNYSRDFLEFLRELSVECEKANLVLSTDNYKPESYNSCYRLKEQSSFVDYVILMAYDEHYAGSEAGSVASLPFVTEAINEVLEDVDNSQLIVGVPFFTRIWKTTNGTTTSSAVGMQAAISKMTSDGYSAFWNDEVSQYVVSYEKDGSTIDIWFEEALSIEAKMKVIDEADVAGVASWKLGLETSDIWTVINKYLNN